MNVKYHEFKTVFRNFVSMLCNNTSPPNLKLSTKSTKLTTLSSLRVMNL